MRALIDPGNLFSTLISEELASKLNLQVQGRHRRVGTAEAGGEVVILGQAKGLRIVLEGGLEPIVIDPHVVRRLAHPLNLGQDFLRQHGCKMEFSDQNVSLMMGMKWFPLIGRSEPLLRSSIDPRFSQEFLKGNKVPMEEKADVVEVREDTEGSVLLINPSPSNPQSLQYIPSFSTAPSQHISPSFSATPSQHVSPPFSTAPSRYISPSFSAAPSQHISPSFSAAPSQHISPSFSAAPYRDISPSSSTAPSQYVSPSFSTDPPQQPTPPQGESSSLVVTGPVHSEMSGTNYSASTSTSTRLLPKSKTKIKIYTKLRAPNTYFEPKTDNFMLNEEELFFLRGFYPNNNGVIEVWVLNLTDKPKQLKKNIKVGKCCHVYSSPEQVEQLQQEPVNVLGHQPAETLTVQETQERKEFLKQQLELDNNELLTNAQKDSIIQIFADNFDSVSVSGEDFGQSELVKFHIQLVPDAKPTRAKCRPLNPLQEEDLKRQLQEWTAAGIIEPSCSEWTSALVPCKKKGTDQLRWSVDFRDLNKMTVKDSYPLPNIDSNLDKLRGAKWFSSLDSAGAFHSVLIDPRSRDLTTFVSMYGTYRFCRMPFGLSNSPAAYCRLVQKALDYLPPGFALAYLDDILVYSKTFDEHLNHLRQVVKLHTRVGMKLNLRKCKVFRTEVDYLGFHVSAAGIGMVPEYVERITAWPLPTTGTMMQSFLGVCNYYRSFIPKFSEITACLNKLRNEPNFELSEAELDAIHRLKTAFTTAPLRAYPDYYSAEPFVLNVDYSKIAMAGILTQKQGGLERFIGAFSKTCDTAESNYAAHKGEAAAIIYSLRKFEHILRAKKFLIKTDSRALTFMDSMREARGIWARWQIYISSFNFDIVHQPGKDNIFADALSRVIPQIKGGKGDDPETDCEKYDNEPLADVDDIYNIEVSDNIKVLSESISKEEWILATRTDYEITLVKTFVKTKTLPSREERRRLPAMANQLLNRFPLLSVEDDLLWYSSPILNSILHPPRVVVPSSLQDRIVDSARRGHGNLQQVKIKMFLPRNV